MKDRLIFDTTSAATIADSDSVGAYLRSSDGTLLTHSNVGTKRALDVSIADGVNVEVDLSHADDSVRIGDGTNLVSVTTAGELRVAATDFDIRDLTAASDSVAAWLRDGSGNSISSTSGSLNVNVTNSLTTSDAALANTAIQSNATTLTTGGTAQDVVSSVLSNRKYLFIYNNSNRIMHIGQSGVTASNGFPVSPGSYIELRAGAAVDVEFVSPVTGHEIRVLQLS